MNEIPIWGTYAPKSKARCLRFLTSTGVARGRIAKKTSTLWRRLHGDLIDIQIRGIKYRMNLGDNTTDTKVLCSSKEYDQKELSALKDSCKDGVFVDAGANVGYYSLAMAQAGAARVLAIEPNPPTLKRLLFHIQINQFAHLITPVSTGIGPKGESTFFSTGDLGSASLIEDASLKNTAITIQTRPLLDLIQKQGVDKIDGMKIDVEGMEDRALLPFFQTAPASLWPSCLVIEHCHQKEWETDIISYLLKNGYQQTGKTRANTILKFNPNT
ncbi:MAG: FkbM family methyltransferase [Kiritimatiellales bacterium]|nr:FkbM family methyltransferase [Kiritimatiellota bacterium]MBL7012341.1 FkbM family methyltransferase [Kiritimatiellales bacterium]